jgi:lipoprotein-anchoring transpeptidase ErfK/SrfK
LILSTSRFALRLFLISVFTACGIATASPAQGAAEIVPFSDQPEGTVVIKTKERRLYYVLGDGKALRYPVGVGRAGQTWEGNAIITGKYLKPAWRPPDVIKRDRPSLPDLIPGGSPDNPMGAAAITLSRGEYAVHGTNQPNTIGHFVSYGCIRMHNQDILDLYDRVSYGTLVVVQ